MHFTDEALSFHSIIAQYLRDQGADIGDTKSLHEYRVLDCRVITQLPLLKQLGLDIKDGKLNLTHNK